MSFVAFPSQIHERRNESRCHGRTVVSVFTSDQLAAFPRCNPIVNCSSKAAKDLFEQSFIPVSSFPPKPEIHHGDSCSPESRSSPIFLRRVLPSVPKVVGIFHESWFCSDNGGLARRPFVAGRTGNDKQRRSGSFDLCQSNSVWGRRGS